MRPLKNIFLLFIGLALFACTKYPENRLNSRKPEKFFKGGVITMYTINGIDNMPKVKAWYTDFPYNYFGVKIDDVFSLPFTFDAESEDFNTEYGSGYMHFNDWGETVDIKFTPKNAEFGAQNFFIQNENWHILKLTKEGQMKIKATINNKFYEMQFN